MKLSNLYSKTAGYVLALAASGVLLPQISMAHPGHFTPVDAGGAIAAGLLHPLTGFDHLLAIVTAGLWSASFISPSHAPQTLAMQGHVSRFAKILPVIFLAAMGIGAALGTNGVVFPSLEVWIALSVLVLGLIVTAQTQVSTTVGALLLGIFALIHGNAHGAEMPVGAAASPLFTAQYFLGFLASTSILLGVSFVWSLWARKSGHLASIKAVGILSICAGGVAALT